MGRRAYELRKKKFFYKLSDDESEFQLPHLDQPTTATLKYFMTEKFHAHWFAVYFNLMMRQSKEIIAPFMLSKFQVAKMTSYQNYTQIAKEVKDAILVRILSDV